MTNLVKLVTITKSPGATLRTVMIANSWIRRPDRLAPSSVPGVTSPKAEERSRTMLPRSASCAHPVDADATTPAKTKARPHITRGANRGSKRGDIRSLRRSL